MKTKIKISAVLIICTMLFGCITAMIDIGGYKLGIRKTGTGQPTVVLESGLGAGHDHWTDVQAAIEQQTTVISYDRAGIGQSEASPNERTAKDMAIELHTLLEKSQTPPPYVLVGHSLGGFIIRMFADMYPDEVAAMVYVDGSHEDYYTYLQSTMSEEEWQELKQKEAQSMAFAPEAIKQEKALFSVSEEQVRNTVIPDVPFIVLSSSKTSPPYVTEEVIETFQGMHASLVEQVSPENGIHIIVEDTGHNIATENPEAVIDAIKTALEMVE